MSEAQAKMKTGSPNVRRDRIESACDDDLLVAERHPEDGRSQLLIPTQKLKDLLTDHLRRTRTRAIAALCPGDSTQKCN
jgi:hypothetical protein